MNEPPHTDDAIVVDFMQRYAEDLRSGQLRSLHEYQALYPGFETAIEHEFESLEAETLPPATEVGTLSAQEHIRSAAELARALEHHRYHEIEEIGRGGMGVVRRVQDQRLRRQLAMKVLATGVADSVSGTDTVQWRRFLDEAQITGRLAHPGVVPVHDLGIDDRGRPFFTMSLIEGHDFRRIIEHVHDTADDDWSVPRAIQVLQRVCDAVAYAHANAVIHRDLKPANVMVGSFGETYVLDWGLARFLDDDAVHNAIAGADDTASASAELRTLDGDVIGTPAYMAPEQARGELDRLDARTDVYAIGAMLYHLLTGRAPYLSPTERVRAQDVIQAVLEGPPPSIAALQPGAPAELIAIAEKAMARDADDRYQSVTQLANDLRAFLEVRVVRAYRTGAFAEAAKWVRRNQPLAWTGAAAVLALALGLVFSLQQKALADAQAEIAGQQAVRADANFGLAKDAIDRMLTKIGYEGLSDVPQMQEMRREILLDSLALQEELVQQSPDNTTARIDLAQAHYGVAGIVRQLGEQRRALEHLDDVEKTLAGVSEHERSSRGYLMLVAGALYLRASIQIEIDQTAEGIATARRSLDIVDAFLVDHPDDRSALRRKARILEVLAEATDDNDLAYLQEAADLLCRIANQSPPDEPFAIPNACAALANLGMVLGRSGRADDAAAALARGFALSSGSPETSRDERRHKSALQALWRCSAKLGRAARDHQRALDGYEHAIAISRELIADFPSFPRYRGNLASCLNDFARVHFESDRVDEALDVLRDAVDNWAIAQEMAPADTRFSNHLTSTQLTLSQVLRETGSFTEAFSIADDLAVSAPTHSSAMHVSIALAERQRSTLPTDQSSAQFERRLERAFEVLRRLVRSSDDPESTRDFLQRSTFDAVRDHEAFLEILREAEQR